ncbi:Type I phosphodiesterase / nucleotide pyrophosphatase [Polystyrenella longa]|uniref:Type I phosphodiesterase / nucleotide pyrophosphatase n=1 Tax=Polystyrenella longa TaxID=2528007 RepID=A0A518CQF8_9PLAN|nr:alkaline phosphatase family protein [Polystyrenella longa]QDU81467.1 Type I phosphodiesterase / nucleotide pyrophosphatase [Polystyrenella longa]
MNLNSRSTSDKSYRRLTRLKTTIKMLLISSTSFLFLGSLLQAQTQSLSAPGIYLQPVPSQSLVVSPQQKQIASEPIGLRVPATATWSDTRIHVQQGEVVTLKAQGKIEFYERKYFDKNIPTECGPTGTYHYSEKVVDEFFPIPSATRGPAPPYALIGRIGNGAPFYVGSQKSFYAPASGPLFLGINDYDCSDNKGFFSVTITRGGYLEPFKQEEVVTAAAVPGRPVPNSQVMVFYIDGLRPDVVREMVAMGHLPNINRLFVSGGTWMSRNCTAFPSDTITSNGTMWTGCFSDRHGLKGQVRFSRLKLVSESYLEPLGPSRSARLLKPQGLDGAIHKAQSASVGKLKGDAAAESFEGSTTSGVQPLFGHLRSQGSDWATGILPMMTEVPPLLWTRSIVREMPMLSAHESYKYVDDANTHYTLRNLMHRDRPVTVVWLPETDSISHKSSRGQFGITRRTIAEADVHIGHIVNELEKQGKINSTYFILVSDHGHHGGQETHLKHFDIANELFHQPRQLSNNGGWVGGGMGMSVRQHRFWNRHPEDGTQDFVFIDGDSDGAARIYLPRDHFHSGKWVGEFKPSSMLAYPIKQGQQPVNLINAILSSRTTDEQGRQVHPIDLVMMRLDESSILISTVDRGQAVIHRKRLENQKWAYRYQVVTDVQPTSEGFVKFRQVSAPITDPLGLSQTITPQDLNRYQTERDWLRLTADTTYPDAVVTLTRHMLWQKNLEYREPEYAPDLVVTARRGWYFGQQGSTGTMHGYPFADATRASFFVSGPNVRRGARIEEPSRLTDLTPTILDMIGMETDPHDFDGIPLRQIYESGSSQSSIMQPVAHTGQFVPAVRKEPLYWEQLNLNAWNGLNYVEKKPYPYLPVSINRPSSRLDLNNIAYNMIAVSDWNVIKLFDDIIAPLSSQKVQVLNSVERFDQNVRSNSSGWISEGVHAVDLPMTSIGDYSVTSLGNMQRINRTVDWVQHRGLDLDHLLASSMGRNQLPGTHLLHSGIDGTQYGVWEVYRFGQRIVVQVLDENLLNGVENGTDRMVNSFRKIPSEVVLSPQQSSGLQMVSHTIQDPNYRPTMQAFQQQEQMRLRYRHQQQLRVPPSSGPVRSAQPYAAPPQESSPNGSKSPGPQSPDWQSRITLDKAQQQRQ